MAYASRSLSSLPHWIDQPIASSELDSPSTSTLKSKPYAIHVSALTVAAPAPSTSFGLPIPPFLRRRRGKEAIEKEIIRDISLNVDAGELAVLLGGSGSGKTTLLNAIACRSNLSSCGRVSFIPYDGSPALSKGDRIDDLVGFVRQEDFLLPHLAVRETLRFSASLRLPASVDGRTRERIIEQTIAELGLQAAANSARRGLAGLSGGERRRLSIGCALVTCPSILILDEPTTGLDSFTAYQLLQTLSRIAKEGRAVVISIHQPRSDSFPLFDKIILLSKGSLIYSAGGRQSIVNWFEQQGYRIPRRTNPCDFVIDVTSIDTRTDELEATSSERVGRLALAWKQRENSSNFSKGGTQSSKLEEKKEGTSMTTSSTHDLEKSTVMASGEDAVRVHVTDRDRISFLRQTRLLTRRAFLNVFRNYGQNVGFFLQALLIGVALGLAFYDPPETPAGIQSLKTVVYQSTPAYFYLSIIISVFLISLELRVFDREREDGLYSTLPWVISTSLSYLPGQIIFPSLYAIIVYYMCGFWRHNLAVNLLSFIAQCVMQQIAASSYALLACSAARGFASASLLANGFSIPFILSSGYLIVNLPVWVGWTRWLSPYFYGFNWIARTQFAGRTFACVGVEGAARNACDGNAVLVGFNFNLDTPLFIFPLGLLGFIIISNILSTLILQTYHPGGVQHAAQQEPPKEISPSSDPSSRAMDAISLFPQANVVVERLSLTVSTRSFFGKRQSKKVILADISCTFPSGQVSVVMGPSGAGKSSFLSVLARRLKSGRSSDFSTTGSILINGRSVEDTSSNLIAFVQQADDHHLPGITVRETLRYASRLRLRGLNTSQQNARAEEVLRMLGLKPCAENLVGGELIKGISGGEKRRLSLAVELLSNPPVLLLDEPLSGLDAFTAANVMSSLVDLAASGRTIIVSVHQPRSDIWKTFDNVLLLARGGKVAYAGSREAILDSLEMSGNVCPTDFNPADFILDLISIDHTNAVESSERVRRIVELEEVRQLKLSGSRSGSARRTSRDDATDQRHPESAPLLKAFPVLLDRSFKNLRRQRDAAVARLANPPFLALLFWLFFARLNLGPSGAQDRVGLLQETTALPFVGMLACLSIFPNERDLFFYEYKTSGRHSAFVFLLAYTVQEVVVSIIASFLFSIIFVFGIGLQYSAVIFVEFWITCFALLSTGESIGIIFSSFFSNGGLAVALVSSGITILSQLNGIISVTLPYYLQIIGWISPMKPQAHITIANEFRGLAFDCTPASILSGSCIATNGQQLLSTFGLENAHVPTLMAVLIGLVVLYRALALLALQIRVASL